MREFLEKNYKENMDKDDTVKLAIRSLLEVVQTGAKNIEVAVMGSDSVLRVRVLQEGLLSGLMKELIFVSAEFGRVRS